MNTTIPELSDDQIESMRFTIMTDVGKAARSKTRRYRQIVLGTATVVALAGIGGTALGSGGAPDASYSTASRAATSDSAARDSGSQVNGLAKSDAAGSEGFPATLQTNREIITTGMISMTVSRPTDAAQKISRWVETVGGRIDSRDEIAPVGDDGGSVHLVIRIPQSKVTGTIDKFRSYGKVNSVNLADQDVTTEGQDLDARIKALRISVARLENLMKDAKSTSDLLKAEAALSERQANLDSLVAQRKGLTDQVSLSSLNIDLSAKPMANSVSPSGFWGGVVSGWNALVSAIDATVHGIGVILPWGLALALLGGIAWVGRRVIRKRV
ncbi:MAG: DUF4349 domain-containing protein [Aeromicrobium sp.]